MQRRRRRRRTRWAPLVYALGLLACALLGGLTALRLQPIAAQQAIAPQSPSIADVAEAAAPAVVLVEAQYLERSRRGTAVAEASGSGVYCDARGLILTNAHVVEGAQGVRVALSDGRALNVTRYLSDADMDVALLYVGDALRGVTPIPLGDSSALRVGDAALVIGYPSDGEKPLGSTLTVGVISALNRKGLMDGALKDELGMIQLDAAINGGNSGGALLDAQGRLVGIPTLKLQSGYGTAFEGLGFAIPIDAARPVIDQLAAQLLSA